VIGRRVHADSASGGASRGRAAVILRLTGGDAADGARHSTSDAQVAPRQEARRAAAQQRTMEVHFRR